MFFASLMKAAIHLGPIYVSNLEIQKNTKFEDIESIQYYSKVGNGELWRDSECEMAGIFITVLGEISIISRSSDQVGKGKSVCL